MKCEPAVVLFIIHLLWARCCEVWGRCGFACYPFAVSKVLWSVTQVWFCLLARCCEVWARCGFVYYPFAVSKVVWSVSQAWFCLLSICCEQGAVKCEPGVVLFITHSLWARCYEVWARCGFVCYPFAVRKETNAVHPHWHPKIMV